MENLALKHIISRMLKPGSDGGPEAPSPARAATILIADDSRTVVHSLRTILEAAGYSVRSARDGEQAVEATRKYLPDLVLMDIVMPRMNGFEATRVLTQDPVTTGIPIVIVSGTDQVSDRVWGMRLGARDFLAKPVRREELLAKVARALAYARQSEREKAAAQRTQAFNAPATK